MSNPDLSKMKQDCENKRDCMEMLQLILDGEASDDQKRHFLEHHLEGCLPCYKNYHLELKIKELLKTKCCGGNAPSDLVERIKIQISTYTSSDGR